MNSIIKNLEKKDRMIVKLHNKDFLKSDIFQNWTDIDAYYGWKIQHCKNNKNARLIIKEDERIIAGTVDELYLRIEEVSNVLAKSNAISIDEYGGSKNYSYDSNGKWLSTDRYFGWEIQQFEGTDKARIVTVDGEPLVCGSYDEMHDRIKEVSDVFSKSNIQIGIEF